MVHHNSSPLLGKGKSSHRQSVSNRISMAMFHFIYKKQTLGPQFADACSRIRYRFCHSSTLPQALERWKASVEPPSLQAPSTAVKSHGIMLSSDMLQHLQWFSLTVKAKSKLEILHIQCREREQSIRTRITNQIRERRMAWRLGQCRWCHRKLWIPTTGSPGSRRPWLLDTGGSR